MHTEIRFTDGVEVPHRHVKRYDGQMVFVGDDQTAHLELGNYLGGGAAGVVYESVNLETYEHVAVKMLNPLGFKLLSNSSMQRSSVLKEGLISDANVCQGRVKMSLQHVWWVKYRGEIVAAYKDARGTLRSLPLRRCIEIWGWNLRPSTVPTTNSSDEEEESSSFNARVVDEVSSSLARKGGETRRRKHNLRDPPDRYVDFLKSREYVYQEIRNMSKLNGHPNVLRLIEVLEYVQDSKTSIFLVLELASGGELFDRIAIDRGTDEDIARHYYRQVLQGIRYCHKKGVCHRDLKPENLLLSDDDEEPTLKIADFGLSSAIFGRGSVTAQATTQLRRLKSVVGSPHYVAPEVLNDNSDGYEGMWL